MFLSCLPIPYLFYDKYFKIISIEKLWPKFSICFIISFNLFLFIIEYISKLRGGCDT